MKLKISPHLTLAKDFWKAHLKSQDLVIDATCGNGHDTLFLAEICKVIGLDIQPQAIESTKKLLEQNGKEAKLHLLSHAQIDAIALPYPPRLIVYNLGYLPRGDKSITTQIETTLISVNKSLAILARDGALSITCYPGHDEGLREEIVLESWAKNLPSDWVVSHYKWPERNRSPSLIWIVRAD